MPGRSGSSDRFEEKTTRWVWQKLLAQKLPKRRDRPFEAVLVLHRLEFCFLPGASHLPHVTHVATGELITTAFRPATIFRTPLRRMAHWRSPTSRSVATFRCRSELYQASLDRCDLVLHVTHVLGHLAGRNSAFRDESLENVLGLPWAETVRTLR